MSSLSVGLPRSFSTIIPAPALRFVPLRLFLGLYLRFIPPTVVEKVSPLLDGTWGKTKKQKKSDWKKEKKQVLLVQGNDYERARGIRE